MLISALDNWHSRCVSVLEDLENQVREVKQKALVKRKKEERDEAVVDKLVTDAKKTTSFSLTDKGKISGGKRGAQDAGTAVGEGNDDMDMDEGSGMGRLRGPKRGGSGQLKNAAKRMMG